VNGEIVPVGQGVGRGVADPIYAQFSGDGSGTLINQESGIAPFRQLTWYDRRGTALAKVGEPGEFGDVHLSPKGSRAVVTMRQNDRNELWLFDLERGSRSRLVANRGTN